jgi:hypothetical protein
VTSRRKFLGRLLGGASQLKPKPDDVSKRRYILNNGFITGFQHHGGPAVLHELEVGTPLTLVREPENIYDKYAVRIEFRGRHIGFIPREQNRTVSELLQQGAPLECSITEVTAAAPMWEAVRIQVSLPAVEVKKE